MTPILDASASRAAKDAGQQLEKRISDCNTRIARLQQMRNETSNTNLALGYRIKQQRLAREVACLVAQRTPETVARMERERGLA